VTFKGVSGLHSAPKMDLVEQGDIGGDKWFRFQRAGTS
jgi:hypothetical protein